MITEDQSDVVALLSSPITLGRAPVERIDTPASIVFLAGYTDEVSRRVYATVMDQADKVVRSGYTAIADAVFAAARVPDWTRSDGSASMVGARANTYVTLPR